MRLRPSLRWNRCAWLKPFDTLSFVRGLMHH